MAKFTLIKEVTIENQEYFIVVEQGGVACYVGQELERILNSWSRAKETSKNKSLKACLTHVNKQARHVEDRVGALSIVGKGDTLSEAIQQAKVWELL